MDLQKEYEQICDDLEKAAHDKHILEFTKINAYRDGYVQACEDFYKMLRRVKEDKQDEHTT